MYYYARRFNMTIQLSSSSKKPRVMVSKLCMPNGKCLMQQRFVSLGKPVALMPYARCIRLINRYVERDGITQITKKDMDRCLRDASAFKLS